MSCCLVMVSWAMEGRSRFLWSRTALFEGEGLCGHPAGSDAMGRKRVARGRASGGCGQASQVARTPEGGCGSGGLTGEKEPAMNRLAMKGVRGWSWRKAGWPVLAAAAGLLMTPGVLAQQ